MVILAQTLFGSRARGDFTQASDVDLLVATNDGFIRHSHVSGVSVSAYPLVDLERMAAAGDLFLCHILGEGRPLYDPDKHFDRLRGIFRLKSSYSDLTNAAIDLGWFLVHHRQLIQDTEMLGRRIAWVVRSILIARSAESGRPLFSRKELSDMLPGSKVGELIAAKDRTSVDPSMFGHLQRFLHEEKLRPRIAAGSDARGYVQLFKDTDNTIALRLLETRSGDGDEY